ncbi:MAG: hypothetical protein EPO08_03925 [Rhodospirillaceae bacterium]|nr:MAG: hypothetical protein EPO08_03925 [Rhodospirillaceae bacterium]
MEKPENIHTVQSAAVDSIFLYERLKQAAIGDLVKYEELSAIISRDVQNDGRHYLVTARRMALRRDRIVFGVVTNVGFKRLNDIEIVSTGENVTGRIRRLSRRGLHTITAVGDFAAMPNEVRIRHNAYASVFGAIAFATKEASVKRVKEAVGSSQARLPIAGTLEAFRG